MITHFRGKRISSILGVLPENDYLFDDEVENYNFPVKQTMRLKRVMGFEKHSISKSESTVSDFASYGIKYMIDNNWIDTNDIGAIVVVSLCPDYFVPHISSIIHGKFNLSSDVICMDLSQGCCGYLLGLFQSFMLLEHLGSKKVLLVNGDVLSHKVSHSDRNDFPLIGDAATISIIENSGDQDIYFEMNNDGSKGNALIIPAGGFRRPSSNETAIMEPTGDGNLRSLDNMHMDGTAVFNFVQTEVPPMIERVLRDNKLSIDEIDRFYLHQPNKFMLNKLIEKLGIPEEKTPVNLVEQFGNPSGSSIPMTMIVNDSDALTTNTFKCCLSAFGSGLAWGCVLMDIGNLKNCEMIRSDL